MIDRPMRLVLALGEDPKVREFSGREFANESRAPKRDLVRAIRVLIAVAFREEHARLQFPPRGGLRREVKSALATTDRAADLVPVAGLLAARERPLHVAAVLCAAVFVGHFVEIHD